jgi:hypothetical protein
VNAEVLPAIRKSPKIQIRLKNSKQNIALTIGVNNEYSTKLPHLRSNMSLIRFETKILSRYLPKQGSLRQSKTPAGQGPTAIVNGHDWLDIFEHAFKQ